jgi:hypothetical protein
VIYFWQKDDSAIYMLVAYVKNVASNLKPSQVKTLRVLVKELS